MPDMNDYHAHKSTSGESGGSSNSGGKELGCGRIVIVLDVIMLLFFITDGASWDAIDSLLDFDFLAFLCARTYLDDYYDTWKHPIPEDEQGWGIFNRR